MAGDAPASDCNLEGFSEIHYDKAREEFFGNFIVWDDCFIHGLDLPSLGIYSESSVVRSGSITYGSEDMEGPRLHSVLALHQVLIDETIRYTLLSPEEYFRTEGKRFVLGVRSDAGQFQKLCVLDFVEKDSYDEIKRIGSRQNVVLI